MALANDFLASEERQTLPEGRLELDEATGMLFRTEDGRQPVRVRVTTWGNLVNWLGFQAQEREDGFVVGRLKSPYDDPLVDNAFFLTLDGEWLGAPGQARLILHELTHSYYREGTVGFWNSLAYYAEAIFLFRSSTHSAEELPKATSVEFGHWLVRDEDWYRQYREMQAEEDDSGVVEP